MMIEFKSNYSFNILLRFIVISALVIMMMLYNVDYLQNVYLKNQLTNTGYYINGFILGLFLLGMTKLIFALFYYWREERSVSKFIINLHREVHNPLDSISEKSLIYHRYSAMHNIYQKRSTINQSALAATMVASESTRLSLPKFVSNILILTGVFGTIISLSIALLGASSLMEDNGIGGMGQVIHGMSTALSTTTTAIVCYLFFGYFYLKLTDVQTNLFSAIEQISTQYLVPRFSHKNEDMIHQLTDLINLLRDTVSNMQLSQKQYLNIASNVNMITSQYDERIDGMSNDITEIKNLLREGFRLPDNKHEQLENR